MNEGQEDVIQMIIMLLLNRTSTVTALGYVHKCGVYSHRPHKEHISSVHKLCITGEDPDEW